MLSKHQMDRRFGPEAKVDAETQTHIKKVQETFKEFASWLDGDIPDGRCKSLALTNLETAVVWAAKAVAIEHTYIHEKELKKNG